MCGILQEKVYKTYITDLDLLTMPLMNGYCNGDVIQLGLFCSQLLFRFVQTSGVLPVWYTIFCSIAHML